jgi:hypothetical protein
MCSVLHLQQVSAQFWSLLWQSHSRTLNMSSHSICYSHEVSPFFIRFQCSYQSSVYTNSLLAALNVRKAISTSSEGVLSLSMNDIRSDNATTSNTYCLEELKGERNGRQSTNRYRAFPLGQTLPFQSFNFSVSNSL